MANFKLVQQGHAIFQWMLGARFQPAAPVLQPAQAVLPQPELHLYPDPDVQAEAEVEHEIDLAALSRAVGDASHALKLARRRESYARKQWAIRHRLWSQERYNGVVRETEAYARALREAERRYQEGRRVQAERDARNRQGMPARRARNPERAIHVNLGREIAEPMVVDPPEEVAVPQPAVDIAALRDALSCAQHELRKARRRESYAKKQWDARHRLWSRERYEGVVRETEEYAEDVRRAERMLREASIGGRGRR
jgi:hypothetical protein